MQIHGLNKTTLLDYPQHVAATVFIGGCNFRCPFCHNKDLVLHADTCPIINEDEVLNFLKKRFGILTGVCVTGGEPTLRKDLPDFLRKIKDIGYCIKLDTNGTNPHMLRLLFEQNLIDTIAMDIKTCLSDYPRLIGTHIDKDIIAASASFLMNSGIDYEFRTTVVKELHTKEAFVEIGKWLHGCKRYFLQSYTENENVIHPGFHSYTKEELEAFQSVLLEYMTSVSLRGIE